jgi:hypothetical protein
MPKTKKTVLRVRTHFEQVPLEVAKAIAAKGGSASLARRPPNVIVERKTEPYSLRIGGKRP